MPAQPEPTDRAEVTDLQKAVDQAIAEQLLSGYRDDTPLPAYGPTPPVAQPWPAAPPMSARATNNARVFMYCSWATVPPGLIAIGILVASQHANPTVIGMICAAPAAIAAPILALARLVRRAGEAAPSEIHQTYMGPVHNDTRITQTRAVWSKTVNKH